MSSSVAIEPSIALHRACELPNILPNFPLFQRLLGFAHRFPATQDAIRDIVAKTSASHLQLLNDVLSLRNSVYHLLDHSTRQSLIDGEEVFLSLLAPPGYEYAVGFLTILALGAVVVPIAPHVPLQEALYFAEKSTAKGLIFDPRFAALGTSIADRVCSISQTAFTSVDISHSLYKKILSADEIYISANSSLDPTKAGLVIFTSGTTGKPKAVVLPREILSSGTQALADHYEITPADTALHCMPVHHVAGITVSFIPFLLAGACIEFEPFNVERVWERWRTAGTGERNLTVFGGVPTMFTRLMRHYEDVIKSSPDHDAYIRGVKGHRFMMSGTSALPRPLRMKWFALTGGKRILERYGTSEFSTGILTPLRNSELAPDGSVGVVLPGCHIKLTNAGEGEILVKAPGMFLRYHGDVEATQAAYDENGYYKTGDIGRREGPYFFISGRASIDIIKSGGYKISALDIEREIIALDYISEVSVMGVADEEFGQRVAAVVVLRDLNQRLALAKLRNDLRSIMSSYKLPTLLYVSQELPRTASGKVQKEALRKDVFDSGRYVDQIEVYLPAKTVMRAKL